MFEPFLAERAPHDRVDVAREDAAGVFERLLATQMGRLADDDDGVYAQRAVWDFAAS